MFTLVNLYTVTLTAHLTFVVFDKAKEKKNVIITFYTIATALLIFFVSDPARYVLTSKPILYLSNFYNAGPYYWVFTLFFSCVVVYFLFFLFQIYKVSDNRTKVRIKYFALSFGWAYTTGSLLFFPIFGLLDVDPVFSSILGLYSIPLAYASLKYDLLELRVVAKNAAIYALSTALVGIVIIAVNVYNNYLVVLYPNYPFWFMPLVSALIVVAAGFYIWRQIREADILKYEFINNISHKFRTPLTHIRWFAEELRSEADPQKREQNVQLIQQASMRLFELTNIVIDVARDSNNIYQYQYSKVAVPEVFSEIYEGHDEQIKRKKQHVSVVIEPNLPEINADRTRLRFAFQILFENALIYTPLGGDIEVSIKKLGDEIVFSVKDDGIGIDPKEIPHLFAKFYRTENARHADTEGMGIGLYMTKEIVEKHNGRIWVTSEGVGKGSTFSLALPIRSR